MDENYWDEMSRNYTDEIFSVLEHDSEGVIEEFLRNKNARDKHLIDYGCGIGHVIPLLAAHAQFVTAVDISKKCLNIAKKKFGHLSNVTFVKADMVKSPARLKRGELAVAVNSIIASSLPKRAGMLKAIRNRLKKNGCLLLVVPSLESFYYTAYRLNEWELREGCRVHSPAKFMFGDIKKVSLSKLAQGMVPIRGVFTKHYLKEELIALLQHVGFSIEEIKKIKYPWKTEFHRPPKWMKSPYPWDWCCIAQKV